MIGRLKDLLEQPWGDCFWAFRRWVYVFDVFEGFEEGFTDWKLVLAALNVKGAWFEIVPKRLSQTA